MKVLLIGASGQLGTALRARLSDVHATTRDEIDLRHPERFAELFAKTSADVVINCGAFHDVPRCETEVATAFTCNAVAVHELARLSKTKGARFVTFSTDYVFDGVTDRPWRETDPVGPLQVYGASKLAGEHAARAANDEALIVRTCGVYGDGSQSQKLNFVAARVRDGRSIERMEMASEQRVSPTYAVDLAEAVIALLAKNAAGGVYHLVNEGSCSWYELTKEIFRLTGSKTELVPVDRGGKTGTMRRPLFSALANEKARALGVTLPNWQDAVARYLRSSANR